MSRIRNCSEAILNTGASACPIDLKRIIGAILVEPGTLLPDNLNQKQLETLCHADRPERVYPIFRFCDYSNSGGEVQTGSVGYGPMAATVVSAKVDTFTMEHADENLNAELLSGMNKAFDVYYVDENSYIYGYDEGDGKLAGMPMAAVLPNNPIFSGAERALMTIQFCHRDTRDNLIHINYQKLDFDPSRSAKGLLGVVLKEMSSGKFKVIEAIGGYDRTVEFGQAIQTGAESVVINGSVVSYSNGLISITSEGTPSLASPSVLYAADIKGIEYVRTEMLA